LVISDEFIETFRQEQQAQCQRPRGAANFQPDPVLACPLHQSVIV